MNPTMMRSEQSPPLVPEPSTAIFPNKGIQQALFMLVHSVQRLVTTEIWNIVMGVKDTADEVQTEADGKVEADDKDGGDTTNEVHDLEFSDEALNSLKEQIFSLVDHMQNDIIDLDANWCRRTEAENDLFDDLTADLQAKKVEINAAFDTRSEFKDIMAGLIDAVRQAEEDLKTKLVDQSEDGIMFSVTIEQEGELVIGALKQISDGIHEVEQVNDNLEKSLNSK
jgi:hypothetical protein